MCVSRHVPVDPHQVGTYLLSEKLKHSKWAMDFPTLKMLWSKFKSELDIYRVCHTTGCDRVPLIEAYRGAQDLSLDLKWGTNKRKREFHFQKHRFITGREHGAILKNVYKWTREWCDERHADCSYTLVTAAKFSPRGYRREFVRSYFERCLANNQNIESDLLATKLRWSVKDMSQIYAMNNCRDIDKWMKCVKRIDKNYQLD